MFKKVEVSENFILNFHDLFLKINRYLTFLVTFKNDLCINSKWVLGTTFLRKYQFVYDFGIIKLGIIMINIEKKYMMKKKMK